MQRLLWRKYASLAVVFPLGMVLQSILPRWETLIPIMIGTLSIWGRSASCIWAISDHSTWGRITNLPQNIPEFFTICLVIPYPRQHLSHALLVSRKCKLCVVAIHKWKHQELLALNITQSQNHSVFHIPVHSFFHSTTIYEVIHYCRCRDLAAIKTHQVSILLYNALGGDPCSWKEQESRKINWWKGCCCIRQTGQATTLWLSGLLLYFCFGTSPNPAQLHCLIGCWILVLFPPNFY